MWSRFIVFLFWVFIADVAFAWAVKPPQPSRAYLNFCASCHGEHGDGLGEAAKFVFPKPRAFTSSPIQFATTQNRIASSEDIKKTILDGIPNSSMVAWKSLTDEQIDTLVHDVIQFRRFGAQQRYFDLLVKDDELNKVLIPDGLSQYQKNELDSYLRKETKPSSKWQATNLVGFTPSNERGRALYREQNCHKCHGEDYRGSYGIDLSGEHGFPAFARDLVGEPYKYGDSIADIMRVIRLGVNGSKMPASTTLTPEQLADLAEFVRTIHVPHHRELTNAQRYQRAIGNLPKRP